MEGKWLFDNVINAAQKLLKAKHSTTSEHFVSKEHAIPNRKRKVCPNFECIRESLDNNS